MQRYSLRDDACGGEKGSEAPLIKPREWHRCNTDIGRAFHVFKSNRYCQQTTPSATSVQGYLNFFNRIQKNLSAALLLDAASPTGIQINLSAKARAMDFTSRYCRRRVENAVTCPNAALAINCCQFSCCLPTIPAIDFPINLHPDWMSNLVQSCPEICLGEMVIPGTHDSGSYSIETFSPFSAVGRTQNVSVLEQLHRGARFLDLRIAGSGSNAGISHGCLKGSKIERILDDIHLFCQDFPGEFVMIEVVAEYGRPFSGEQKKQTLDVLKQSLGDKLYTSDDREKLMKTPLKEVILGGKQVCILLHARIYEDFQVDGVQYTDDYIKKEYGFFSADSWLENKWKYVDYNNMRAMLASLRFASRVLIIFFSFSL